MNIKDIEKGMYVFINKNCENTKRVHGFNNRMRKFLETNQLVKEVRSDCVLMVDFLWHPKDLSIPKKIKKKIKSIQFDIKELNL